MKKMNIFYKLFIYKMKRYHQFYVNTLQYIYNSHKKNKYENKQMSIDYFILLNVLKSSCLL